MRPDKNAEYHKISESDWDGIWYPADGGKEKIMIVVSGSDGGLEHAGKHAHFLADNGSWRCRRLRGVLLSMHSCIRLGSIFLFFLAVGFLK